MPTFRVTYRPYAGARRLLLEDIEADRHDIRGGWHVLAQVQLVCWTCKLRAPARDVVDVQQRTDTSREHRKAPPADGVAAGDARS